MGRKALDKETLQKRGSWRAKTKDAPKPQPVNKYTKTPDFKCDNWPELLKSLPGYNPYHPDYYFDETCAAKAIDFFQQELVHVKGEKTGHWFVLERWEQAIIANLFGWKDKETHFRRYKEAFIEVGRKNGKTPLAAGILLYLLFEDGEPGAEIYGAASEYKQASLVFTHAWGMVRRNPALYDRAKIFKGQAKSIEVGQPGDDDYGIYRVISSDSFAAHGFNTHAAVVDELHTQPNRDLVDALNTSTGARRQPLIIYITTSDFERDSICNEYENYAVKVLEGTIKDDTFLPVIYKASIDDDWIDPEVWKKANPNLGVSVSVEYLTKACQKAKESPSYENTFKRLHLNIRTQQDVRWLQMGAWDACDGRYPEENLLGRSCFGGLDLSTNTDITACVLVFPIDDKYVVLPRFWIPADNAKKRSDADRVPYVQWAKDGFLKMTPGNVVDYDTVKHDVFELFEKYNIEMAFDRWNFEALRQMMVSEGIPEEKLISFGQGYVSMSAPTKELEKIVLSKQLIHNQHPVLRWMASNVTVEQDAAGNLKPSKAKSTERIDGIVALIMALGRAITVPPEQPSVYSTRGILRL